MLLIWRPATRVLGEFSSGRYGFDGGLFGLKTIPGAARGCPNFQSFGENSMIEVAEESLSLGFPSKGVSSTNSVGEGGTGTSTGLTSELSEMGSERSDSFDGVRIVISFSA